MKACAQAAVYHSTSQDCLWCQIDTLLAVVAHSDAEKIRISTEGSQRKEWAVGSGSLLLAASLCI